jgi:hypothetical protein
MADGIWPFERTILSQAILEASVFFDTTADTFSIVLFIVSNILSIVFIQFGN